MARSRTQELALFFEKMAQMQQAGLPLREALDMAALQLRDPDLRRGFTRVRMEVARGATLSQAFTRAPGVLSGLQLALIGVGEAGGSLDRTLVDLATLCRREERTRRELLHTLYYPGFLLLGALLLPPAYVWFTQGLLAYLSTVAGAASVFVVPAGLAYALFRLGRASAPQLVDGLLLRLPVVGRIARGFAFGRFCRGLGALLAGGLGVREGMELALGALGNQALVRRCRPVLDGITRGDPLAQAMAETDAFPVDLVQRLAIAERAGQLDRTLQQAAEDFDYEAQQALRTWIRILPMLALVLVGLRVATAVMGFYSGYMQNLDRLDRTLQQEIGIPQ